MPRRAQVGGRPGQGQYQQGEEITYCNLMFYVPAQYGLFPSKALRDIVLYDHRRSYRRVSRDAGNHGKAHTDVCWSCSSTELFSTRRPLQYRPYPSRATLLRSARSPAAHHDARSTTRDPRHGIHDTRSTKIFGNNVKCGQISGFEKLICKKYETAKHETVIIFRHILVCWYSKTVIDVGSWEIGSVERISNFGTSTAGHGNTCGTRSLRPGITTAVVGAMTLCILPSDASPELAVPASAGAGGGACIAMGGANTEDFVGEHYIM